jgi:dipeptidyl aminopeptidase/acylaminoacyl peptidase
MGLLCFFGMQKYFVICCIFLVILFLYLAIGKPPAQKLTLHRIVPTKTLVSLPTSSPTPGFPLSLAAMEAKLYPGSDLTIEQMLSDGNDYKQYVVSYLSDGFKIYGLLTVPIGTKPTDGWPVILLNHGYIPPNQYSTTQSYNLVVAPFASHGYIVFKPDYRGNAHSQGTPTQPYVSADYVTDSMNALASIKRYKYANPEKIGILGHSMGGNITLHEALLTHDIQAVDLWSGVVGSYSEILDWWKQRIASGTLQGNDADTAVLVKQFIASHGTPQSNPAFWKSIDPIDSLSRIQTPVFIQVGTADIVVPPSFSVHLSDRLKSLGKQVSLQEYQGADHNLSPDSAEAIQDSLKFFDRYLK